MLNLQPLRDRLGPNFQPFTIHLSDGRSFSIPHTDFVAVGRGVFSVIDARDVSHTLDPLHIVSLGEVVAPRDSNGS